MMANVGRPDGIEGECDMQEAHLYLVGDPRKCTGCRSCMLMCALAHEGRAQLHTARILIVEDVFGSFPTDILLGTCRQCRDAACVTACPAGALAIDQQHFNVRYVDRDSCTGCRKCIGACHFSPSRVRFDAASRTSTKCDLCRDTPYWRHDDGELACVQVCPVRALDSTSVAPLGASGYEVNRRREGWARLGMPTDEGS